VCRHTYVDEDDRDIQKDDICRIILIDFYRIDAGIVDVRQKIYYRKKR